METCEVTFDETMPCTTSVFKCASEQEIGESIFVEEQEDADWVDHASSFFSMCQLHLKKHQLLLRGI
jgi:hypothetical protein